eukprot:COSAG03_NODE_20829_length_313_cov_0.714953_1_plen_54_part_00
MAQCKPNGLSVAVRYSNSGGAVTPYYVLGAVASEGLGGGAMKARNNLERGGGR